MIFIIDSDVEMSTCLARACDGYKTRVFHNAIDAMQGLNDVLPELILMDIMLTGPDGFSFLNELISYDDTSKIPVVITSELDLTSVDLSVYNVVGALNKDTMRPEDVKKYITEYGLSKDA